MKIEALRRTFAYNAIDLADPGAALTPAAVKDFYTSVYPDLTNAEIEGPKVVGSTHAYTFRRAVGTKGADNAQQKKPRLFYYEDAEDCWAPADGLELDNILGDTHLTDEGEEVEIRFKRIDMTDAEFEALPEA